MQIKMKYEEIMREVDVRIAAIDLKGKNIIEDSKAILLFLKEKLIELKLTILSESFEDETEEITFFKYQKPLLLGRLMFFYKVLHIESNCPPCMELTDDYYRKQQEEQKLFFDRIVGFYQYYRSGATYRDRYYFLREKQEICPETELFLFEDEPEFSTGYDRLVARIIAMEMLYAYLTSRRRALAQETTGIQVSALVKLYPHAGTEKQPDSLS